MQKTAWKNSKYSRNGKILKIGQLAKAIANAKAKDFAKMVSLAQKLKMLKTCENPFYKNIRVVLRKKPPKNNRQYSRNETSFKIGHLAKAIANAKAIDFAKMVSLRQKLKMPKTCEKLFYKTIRVVLCKKPLEKASNIREIRRF